MSVNIIRAWKDAAYFDSLSEDQKAMVPANPAGNVDIDMGSVTGGGRSSSAFVRVAASCTASSSSSCCRPKFM